jgi:SAM-dependent methyltransferase
MITTPLSPATAADAATWNNRFGGDTYLFGTAPNTWLQSQAAVWTANQRVLSVADGEGRNSVFLARQGLSVDAFDVAEVGVNKAQKLASRQNVRVNFSVCGCDEYPWPVDAYDGVAAIFVQFADPAMRARLFANIKRSLKPGGYFVLHGYTPKQLEYKTGGPPLASHLYTAEMLREAFRDFEIVELREYEDELSEGVQHKGRSALIGLVARRPMQAQ